MIYILDRNYNIYKSIDVDYTFTKELNKLNTLEFSTDFEIPKESYIVIKDNGKYYEFVLVDSEYRRENSFVYSYFCQDTLIETSGYVIKEERPTQTVIKHLEMVFKGTGWEIVNKSSYTSIPSKVNYYRINVLEAFKKILETFDIEWETNFIVSNGEIVRRQLVVGKIGKTVNSRLEFNKNIKRFERKILPDPVYTALIGLGKGEEKFDESGKSTGGFTRRITFADVNNGIWHVTNEEAREKYGIGSKNNKKHYFGFVVFADETDKTNLLKRTKEELKKVSRPQVEYNIDVANINIDVNLGDEVPAIDEVLGFRDYIRVIKVEKSKLETQLTFGVITKALSTLSKLTGQSVIEQVTENVSARFSEELNRVVDKFNNEDGYNYDLKAGNKYGLPAGYYSFNKPIDENPTKVVYMGAGKVMIADEKGSDGNWKWKTAIDGTGIAGGEILSNSITVNKLAPDVGQGLDLSSNKYIESIVSNNSDISDEVYEKISKLNSSLEDKVSESTINKLLEEINNQLNVNSTKISQNKNKLEVEFNSIKAGVENNRADLKTLTSTITSSQDDEGNAYTEWGSTGDAKVRVGANGIDIISNDQEVMSFRDGEAYAKALYVTETIGFGNHTAQKYGTKYTIFSPNSGG